MGAGQTPDLDQLTSMVSDLALQVRRERSRAKRRQTSTPQASSGFVSVDPPVTVWTASDTGSSDAGAWSAWETLDSSSAVPDSASMVMFELTYTNSRATSDPSDAICGIGIRKDGGATGVTVVNIAPVWNLLEQEETEYGMAFTAFVGNDAQIRYRKPSDDYTYTLKVYGYYG